MSASLKDVAAHAGVSVRTVSNVVNDFAQVAPATRARVQRSLDELGYRPNLAARTLRRGRTGLIALVVPEVASPYFGEIASLLTVAAQRQGWTLLIDQTRGNVDLERQFLEGVRAQSVDGLVLSPWSLPVEELRRRTSAVPLVLLGERAREVNIDHVAIDNVGAARMATEHLLGVGRRRVAAVGARSELGGDTAGLRLIGYREALDAAGLVNDPALEVGVTALHRADGARAMQMLLDSDAAPDALFCANDQLALGAIRVALGAGLRIPQDLAVVGVDDIEDGRYATPSLTTVSPDKEMLAKQVIECLRTRLDRSSSSRPSRDVVVPHRLVVRESTLGAAL